MAYPVEVLFRYMPNGRLKVRVIIPDTDRQMDTEIIRDTGLDQERLDGWRKFICGLPPGERR